MNDHVQHPQATLAYKISLHVVFRKIAYRLGVYWAILQELNTKVAARKQTYARDNIA